MIWALSGVCVFTYCAFHLIAFLFVDCDLRLAFLERFGKSLRHLKGKVIFITGASSGIGEYTAYALAKHGAKLILAARRRSELESVKAKCLQLAQGQLKEDDVLVIVMDVREMQTHQSHFDSAVEHFGHVDVLFNNAGRSQRALWEQIELSVDKELFELNVFAVVNLTRVALAHFHQRGSGHISVTSSFAGRMGVAYSGSYTGAKHALHGYMNSLRNEQIGKGISVSLFCPGPVYTDFLQESFTGRKGDKYGVKAQATDRRMTAKRCGQLCAVGIANKVDEGWMARFPLIPALYCSVYFPLIFQWALNVIGPEKMFRLRDASAMKTAEVHEI